MDFKFSKGSSDAAHQEPPAEKKNQSVLLVLLLILVGGFAYIYFFTGLIKPLETPKPAEAPAPQVVKMPLPAPASDTAADSKVKDQKVETAPPKAQTANAVPASVVAQPAAPAAVAVPAAKTPAPQTAKPKQPASKAEPTGQVEKKASPAPAAEKKEQKETAAKAADKKAAVEKKQAPADKKVMQPAKNTVAESGVVKPKKVVAAAAATAKQGSGNVWTLLVGQYVLEEALSTDMGRVRKAGFEPVVKSGVRIKTAMNRLVLAEFADRTAAQSAIDKLKRHTSDAFMIEQNGKQVVYAGSYLLDARATSEKERLGAAGFSVTLRRAEIAIPSQSLSIGPFNDKKSADAALGKLKGAGIKATLIHQ